MSVKAIRPDYHGDMKDSADHYRGQQLLYIGWDRHLMFAAALCIPVPPEMPFGALQEAVLPGLYGQHPDFARIDWGRVEWLRGGQPFMPDPAASLAANGIGRGVRAVVMVRPGPEFFLLMFALFKIGAVPFHAWTPDVYQGAPTPVTGFMAICTKLAAVGATLRVFYVALGGERWTWQPLLAVLVPAVVGVLIEKLAIEPVKGAETVTLIIITIGASLVIRGLVQVFLGKNTHSLPAFSGDAPIEILGATLMPQSLWVMGVTAIVVVVLWYFFNRTLTGKAMLATSFNRVAAELVGINTNGVLFMSFAMSAALGAMGGILITPITLTSYDVGIMLGLKGFVAAVLGGLGNGLGAVVGGLLVGVLEAMGAGYLSSAYKDAIPFVLILFILFFMPRGLFGAKVTDRV